MKRIVLTVMALLLCFMLLGCAKEPVKTDLPKVEETVTPSEIETPETPVEPETPTESEQPTEPEEPIEPEQPTEPEEPTEPTQTEETEKNVIILPEADENTIHITIDFPEDFPEEPYTEPNLVSPEEFEWGEYVPFVELDGWSFRQHMYTYDCGIITSHCKNLDSAKDVYDKLNEVFLVESEIIDKIYCEENEHTVSQYGDRYIDFLFRSKIIYISQEADKIGNIYYTLNNTNDTDYLVDCDWTKKYVTYENEMLVNTIEVLESPQFNSGGYIDESSHDFLYPEIKIGLNQQKFNIEYIDENACIYTDVSSNATRLFVYSISNKKVIYCVEVPRDFPYTKFKLEQFINGRYLLFTIDKGVYDKVVDYYTHWYFHTYIYDLKTNELSFLEQYTLNPCISPDLKYLCYTSDTSEAYGYGMESLMPTGFYIKNLENGETVFYEFQGYGLFGVMSWVNEEKLIKLIKG